MPEGHTVHRLARRFDRELGGHVVAASSPQGRFSAGAALVDGTVLERVDAHGKHLWLGFGAERWVHVHLGLYGAWAFGAGEPPEPRGALRLRLVGGGVWADLRGPTACEVHTPAQKEALQARLGPDPLRRDGRVEPFAHRLGRTRTPVGVALMQQDVVAGVGNVYRAEVLFRARLDPARPARDVAADRVALVWEDLRVLMRDGVRRGRIVTTHRDDRSRRSGAVVRADAHYVYRRTGLPCRVCGTAVLTGVVAGRNLYWCAVCQVV